MTYELQFLFALGLTIGIEIPVLWIVLRKEALALHRILAAGFFASFATLPYVWFILPWLIRSHWPYVLVSEGSVLLVETLFYLCCLGLSFRKAFTASLLCNAASFLAGELVKLILK